MVSEVIKLYITFTFVTRVPPLLWAYDLKCLDRMWNGATLVRCTKDQVQLHVPTFLGIVYMCLFESSEASKGEQVRANLFFALSLIQCFLWVHRSCWVSAWGTIFYRWFSFLIANNIQSWWFIRGEYKINMIILGGFRVPPVHAPRNRFFWTIWRPWGA